MTDVDCRSAGRLMAFDSFNQKSDFHKMLWLLCWNVTSHRSKQPEIGNVQDDGNYSL